MNLQSITMVARGSSNELSDIRETAHEPLECESMAEILRGKVPVEVGAKVCECWEEK